MEKYNVISLFSGCGGLDLGFKGDFQFLGQEYAKNKFNILFANDVNKDACLSYKNFFNHDILCGSILDVIAQKGLSTDPFSKNIDVILGGFPCQDFSHAGKRLGFQSERGNLYRAMCEVITKTKPLIFLAENVKGLLTMDQGNALRTIISDFESLGYQLSYKLLMAADFGVPQKRERVIIIGTRKDILPKFEFPSNPQNKWISLQEAIGDLEGIEEGKVPNHYWSKAKKNKGQGNTIVRKENPAPTIRSEHHGNIEFHWNEKRRLSAREAARIQSFPDNFVFYPSTSSAYKQIGNAVPPVFAWHLAKMIENFLDLNLSP